MTNKIGKKRKITFWTRLGFGMGGMLNSGALTFTHSYMVLFLSTECGLSAGEAALISSFAIYVNAILCPLMGFVADNFYATKIGRQPVAAYHRDDRRLQGAYVPHRLQASLW